MKRLWISLICTVFAAGSLFANQPVNVGDPAPVWTAIDQDGEFVYLDEIYDTGLVLVFFYPKAGTGGCTAQACSLRDAYDDLQDHGVTVIGVSMDEIEDQKAFHEENNLPYTLVSDPNGELVKEFGVPYHGQYASRQAFLIKDGTVVWRDLSASTDQQAADVLHALSNL